MPHDERRETSTAEEVLLVLRARGGDAAAFEELVGLYHKRVYYFVRKMLGHEDRVDDVVQEAWFDVWRAVGKLREAGTFRGWVYRVARDRVYRELRRRGWREEVGSVEGIEVEGAGAGPGEELFRAEDAGRVNAALERLPAAQREVLLLTIVERMSGPQVAAVVGCGPGTVRSRVHYAKRALKRILEQETGHDERSERTTGIAAGGR